MDPWKLIELTQAEVACNRATARIDGQLVVVARMGESEMQLTEEGEQIAAALNEQSSTKQKKAKAPASDA